MIASAPQSSPPRSRWGWLAPALLPAVMGALAFAPSIRHPFLMDDYRMVQTDPRLRTPLDWGEILWSPLWYGDFPVQPLWRPLLHASLALNRLIFGMAPAGFRVVNLGLHAMVCALLFFLMRALGGARKAALLGGCLFALHPVHTEAVVSIVGRSEILSALGVLLTGIWGRKAIQTGRLPFWILALLAYAAAIFSKEQGFLAPVFLAMIWLCANPRFPAGAPGGPCRAEAAARGRNALWLGAGLLAVGAMGFSLRMRMFGFHLGFRPETVTFLDNPLIGESNPLIRLGTSLRLTAQAIGLMIFPEPLSPDYSHPQLALGWRPLASAAGCAFASAALALLAGWLATGKRSRPPGETARAAGAAGEFAASGEQSPTPHWRRARIAALGIVWFFLAFLPVSNFLVLNGSIFGERWLYLPSAGACLSLAIAMESALEWLKKCDRFKALFAEPSMRRIGGMLAAAILLAWCWRAQTPWRSARALYEHAVRAVPQSAKAHYCLGLVLIAENELNQAAEELSAAIRLWPKHSFFWAQLGNAQLRQDRLAEAEANLRKSLALNAAMPETYDLLGNALARQTRYREALWCFEAARRQGLQNPEALARKIAHTRNLSERKAAE